MSYFNAQLTQIEGKRSADLNWRANARARPRTIRLLATQDDPSQRLPFAYQFISETALRPYPIIEIVAAPGVSILRDEFPNVSLTPSPQQGTPQSTEPRVVIYRVQDPGLIPFLGTELKSGNLIGTAISQFDEFLWYRDPSVAAARAEWIGTIFLNAPQRLKVDRQRDGVIFKHFASGMELIVRVPDSLSFIPGGTLRLPEFRRDDNARFAYEVNPHGVAGDPKRPLMTIVKTRSVEVSLATQFADYSLFGVGSQIEARQFWKVYEVDNFGDVPVQGAPIVPARHWRTIERIPRVPPLKETLTKASFDIAIGLIPIVGDVVDLFEFGYAAATGVDRWGQAVTFVDLCVLAVGAMLPFVSSGALRGGKTVAQRFGDHSDEATDVLESLRHAGVAENTDLLIRMERTIIEGGQLSAKDFQEFAGLLRRVEHRPPVLDDLMKADESGFLHADLQEMYQRYSQRIVGEQKKLLADAKTPQDIAAAEAHLPSGTRDWALRQTDGKARVILVALLGPDYAKRVKTTPTLLNLGDVPRPAAYTDELFQKDLTSAMVHPKLLDRLQHVFTEPRSTVPSMPRTQTAVISEVLTRVDAGHFRILKGNAAEILSSNIQRNVFETVLQSVPPQYRDKVKLISGVQMRIMENRKLSPRKLFTDNIIAMEQDGKLKILAVFEVKSGYHGGRAGAEQIFEWIEGLLEDGSQLVIPKGSYLMSADGSTRTVIQDLTFTYKPKGSEPEVIYLANAQRHLITAQGVSHLGVDSGLHISKDVINHPLHVTSADLDYLVATMFSFLHLR